VVTRLALRFRDRAPFPKGNWTSRALWALVLAIPIGVLVTATRLTPTAAHGGTHTQLGLEPCGFYDFTGYPCPGCGLTTGFAHLVRGNFADAWAANPFGPMFFLFTLGFIVFATIGLVRGWAISETYRRLEGEWWLIGIALVAMAVWIWRVVAITLA
jgi:hypothetical protein